MEAEIQFKFDFEGLEVGIVEYNYSPPSPYSYWEPPDPEDLEISKIKVFDTFKKQWFAVPDVILDWLLENEDFYSEAIEALHKKLDQEIAERAEDEADYRYELMRDRRMEE